MKSLVNEYMSHMERIGHALLRTLILSLGIQDPIPIDFNIPTVLFRIFHYPPHDDLLPNSLGVGEHTDYVKPFSDR
jgi:isopenicillin N synthase-like dioxygenase